jgi:cytoskeletal protein CcmA (bactofilin family)
VANDQQTVLSPKANFDGKLEAQDVTLKGRFRGEVKASGSVRIDEGSDVDAKVEAPEVVIGGRFRGDVKAGTLRLLEPARASGTFRAQKLAVEEGGQLDGDFEIGAPQADVMHKRAHV